MRTTTALKLFTLALFWIGCDAMQAERVEGKKTKSANLENTSATLLSVKKAPAAIPDAIDIQPANAAVTDRTNVSFTFSGFTTVAGQTVEVQVLSSADQQVAESNWVPLATATTSTTATSFNDPEPIFRWEVRANPSSAAEWLEGGLVRYRAVAVAANGEKTLLPFYDASAGDCIAKLGTKSWKEVLKQCKSPFSPELGAKLGSTTKAATLVSRSVKPGDDFFPNYLSRRGFSEIEDTINYYDTVGAPQSLDEFAERFGFFDGPETAIYYYNLGDLSIGREIHCRNFDTEGGGTACITKNYGVDENNQPAFSGDPDAAMIDLLNGENSFAAVCMVKFGTQFADPNENDVQFFVYGADGNIVDRAALDTFESNDSLPNNCLNCHGGIFDPNTGSIKGASFLPFDPEGFLFADEDGFRYEDQEDAIRDLNNMMKGAGAPPGTLQYVDGTYKGKADVEGTKADFDWIPSGWAVSPEAKTMYREVYKPFCRTCHTSQTGPFAFLTYEDFKSEAAKTLESACSTNDMPVAEATMNQFWRSGARAYLVNALDIASACTPVGGR